MPHKDYHFEERAALLLLFSRSERRSFRVRQAHLRGWYSSQFSVGKGKEGMPVHRHLLDKAGSTLLDAPDL